MLNLYLLYHELKLNNKKLLLIYIILNHYINFHEFKFIIFLFHLIFKDNLYFKMEYIYEMKNLKVLMLYINVIKFKNKFM